MITISWKEGATCRWYRIVSDEITGLMSEPSFFEEDRLASVYKRALFMALLFPNSYTRPDANSISFTNDEFAEIASASASQNNDEI